MLSYAFNSWVMLKIRQNFSISIRIAFILSFANAIIEKSIRKIVNFPNLF